MGDALPVGAVRRYGAIRPPVATGLVQGRESLMAFRDGELLGVVRETCISPMLAACGVAYFGLADGDATELVRWHLATNLVEPLARIPQRIRLLACNDDATRIAALAHDPLWLGVFDGNGALRWERDLSSAGLFPVMELVVEAGDGVTLYCHLDDPEIDVPDRAYDATAHVARDGEIRVDAGRDGSRDTSRTRASWQREPIATGFVAISRDGTRVATGREMWTRADATPIDIMPLDMAVGDLAFDAGHELRRLCFGPSPRGWKRSLQHCIARTSTPTAEASRLVPFTDREVVRRDDVVTLGERVLVTDARDARLACAFDGSAIAVTVGTDATIFDADGKPLRTLASLRSDAFIVAPRGTAVVCWLSPGFAIVRDTGDIAFETADGTPPAFSPDGTTIAYGHDGRLHTHDLVTHEARASDPLVSRIRALTFALDGALFTETEDGRVTEWNPAALPRIS
ncbi:MAG TPA: hypothetical protein VFQ53_04515 [Kofleriaceae bacterium]|nr:hypothetical protein [Kofleriaceae bacterium]